MIHLLVFLFSLPALALPRPAENNLSHKFAQFRREQVKSVQYALHFTFEKGREQYQGNAKLQVELANTKSPLSLDWVGPPFRKVTVNGKEVKNFKTQTGSVEIPAAHLKARSEIEIEFTNGFSKEGQGIQRVVDPEDKAEYFYTDFEPYEAHELFPGFDQPDLKASFDLTITAPSEWTAIGNEPVAEQKDENGLRTTRFRPTPPMSTYLFFLGVGPFAEWKDSEGATPLYLYARKSLAKYVDHENLFATAKKALRFFANFFDTAHPYSKFSLVFVPEFSAGGMENPGAITVNERNLFRGPVPQSRRDARDNLILHETAHLWFGDLVTMAWWNDLWLNESFATYLATIAQDRALGKKSAWIDFANDKGWGYWQDQLPTTHPIETPVKDVRFARGNFDGITYAKGAAALQQLHFYVGEDAFAEGVQKYFRRHAFANAERAHFVGAIAEAAQKDLAPWTRAWLQTSGPNRVRAQWHCRNGLLAGLEIVQEPSSSGTLSPHRARVGLFEKKAEELALAQSLDVAFEKRVTPVKIEKSWACPDFVYPNLDDKDYALFSIDEVSLKNADFLLGGGVRDPLLRILVWKTLEDMVRYAKLSPLRYFEIASRALVKEDDEAVLAVILGRHSPLKDLYTAYLSPKDRVTLAPAFEATLLDRVQKAEKGGSQQMLFFDFLSGITQSPAGLETLRGMIENSTAPEGITLDQDRRWNIVFTLARNGHASSTKLVEAEEKRDPSDTGVRNAYASRVAMPTLAAKSGFWKAVENPEKIPPSTLQSAAREFHQPNDLALSGKFTQDFFARLKKIDWKKSDQLVHVYFERLFPHNLCSQKLLEQSRRELKSASYVTPLARRAWIEANDELARCVRVGRR